MYITFRFTFTCTSAKLTSEQMQVLELTFGEIFQLSSLFIEWDWERYFSQIGSENAHYDLVNPGMALKLIEKLKDDKKNRQILSSLNITKRKKDKIQEAIRDQLRDLIKDWSLLTVPHHGLNSLVT